VDGYQLTVFTVMPRQSIDKRARGADVWCCRSTFSSLDDVANLGLVW